MNNTIDGLALGTLNGAMFYSSEISERDFVENATDLFMTQPTGYASTTIGGGMFIDATKLELLTTIAEPEQPQLILPPFRQD